MMTTQDRPAHAQQATMQPQTARPGGSRAAAALARSPRMVAQRQTVAACFGPAAERAIALEATPTTQRDGGAVMQRKLRITSKAGTFTYVFGKDFTRDHLGSKDDALATLRQRWKEHGTASPVTVIAALDGDHAATDVTPLSGYGFSILIDVDGWTAYWNSDNKAVALAMSSVTLSGYIKGSLGLITHISSSS